MYIIERVMLLDCCKFPFLGLINCTRYVLLIEFTGKMHCATSIITIVRRCCGLYSDLYAIGETSLKVNNTI